MSRLGQRRPSSDDSGHGILTKVVDDARKRLIETGTRNRLVHVNRSNTRGNVLNLVGEQADSVYPMLATHKALRFIALGNDGGEAEIGNSTAPYHNYTEHKRDDTCVKTRLGPDALQKKLLKIAREAQTAEEESGVNILYFAIGFLTWFEHESSSVAREAPLFLIPVDLIRSARTSTYDLKLREDELSTNLPLQQRLKDDFGIELPELHVEEGWFPSQYFAHIEAVISQRSRWKIDPNGMQLGFFSFSKMLMYRDLAVDAWPDGALSTHPLTRGLLYEGFAAEAPMFGANDRLDEILPPEKLFHVVDADASQAKVIEEVRLGRNLVVQGPPGTGKSQTITNMIAAAVREGKRVLFVAEKMAALSVVQERLVKVGLRDVCLELHSRNANKKAVLGELKRTIDQGSTIPRLPMGPNKLREVRDRLNVLTEAQHFPIEGSGEKPLTALARQARFIGAGWAPPKLRVVTLASMTSESEQQILGLVKRYGALLEDDGSGEVHPFDGARNLDLQPVDLVRLESTLSRAKSSVESLFFLLQECTGELAVDTPPTLASVEPIRGLLERLLGLPTESAELAQSLLGESSLGRLRETAKAGAVWRAMHERLSETFVDSAFGAPITHLRGPLAAGASSFFARWGGGYRAACRELAGLLRGKLPNKPKARVDCIDRLSELMSQRAVWEADAVYSAKILREAWRHERTDFVGLCAVLDWCDRIATWVMVGRPDAMLALASQPNFITARQHALAELEPPARVAISDIFGFLDIDLTLFHSNSVNFVPLDRIARRFGAMSIATHRYTAWAQLTRHRRDLKDAGFGDLADRMAAGELDGSTAAIELTFARAEAIWRTGTAQSSVLRNISMEKRHDLVARFAELERQHLKDNVTTILAGHRTQLPQGAQGEMGVIRGEIAKKTRHLAIRKLVERAGSALQRIKPVLLMSPISVAQFLPPGALDFDLLIIDEASQVRPEDALGAIARARQIVVVGDQKQLPPSSFFDRLVLGDEDTDGDENISDDPLAGAAKVGEMESILTLCEARGLTARMLKWHYRSRDPSLIAVSNREFYDNGLVLPPSPLEKDPSYGLCFTRVNGAYDKGGKRDNRIEGEAIVARIAEHARLHPTLSLGVVTFSAAQKNLITELLEFNRRSDGELDHFLREGQYEDVFVKNIENVQGDERDVILVSVGYGPTFSGGRLTSMSFGPVNSEGGERRLNVLFTRSRVRCEIFASFDPEDIDVSRTAGAGPRILRRFLDYAKNGRLDESTPTGLDADSPLEEDVSDVIRSFGFLADPQVGSTGFRIDIGVRHPEKPGVYLLAVECDGATYHSALWARERDRLRQDVLEHLGWRFHRIWSTDWFYNRHAEIDRLQSALLAASDAFVDGIQIDGANVAKPKMQGTALVEPDIVDLPPVVERQMPPYRRATFSIRTAQEPHEVAVSTLADVAKRIVGVEGPIHTEEVARRIASCFGKEKAGSRILNATILALAHAQASDVSLVTKDSFWFTSGQAEHTPVRDRSAESGSTFKAESISMLEIEAALEIARIDNAGGDDQDMVRTAGRLLGYKRVGPDLQARIARGLRQSH